MTVMSELMKGLPVEPGIWAKRAREMPENAMAKRLHSKRASRRTSKRLAVVLIQT